MDDAKSAGMPLAPDPRATGAGPLLRLTVVVAAGVGAAVAFGALPVLVVVLALVAMIMLHELGHFAAAKWSGMKVTEYFLGFGPRLWSIRRGETEYGVKAIPAGGYVRIVGMTMLEQVDPSDEERSYRQASFPRRLLVAFAGSGMHMIIAFVLLFSLYAFSGAPTLTSPTISSLGHFSTGPSPAQRGRAQARRRDRGRRRTQGSRPGLAHHPCEQAPRRRAQLRRGPRRPRPDPSGHTGRRPPRRGTDRWRARPGREPRRPCQGRHRSRAHQCEECVCRAGHRHWPRWHGVRFPVRPDLQRAGPGLLAPRAERYCSPGRRGRQQPVGGKLGRRPGAGQGAGRSCPSSGPSR